VECRVDALAEPINRLGRMVGYIARQVAGLRIKSEEQRTERALCPEFLHAGAEEPIFTGHRKVLVFAGRPLCESVSRVVVGPVQEERLAVDELNRPQDRAVRVVVVRDVPGLNR